MYISMSQYTNLQIHTPDKTSYKESMALELANMKILA